MKKTFKTFALMLLTALAFSSCVDVPAPYNLPNKNSNSGENTSGETIEPQGDGTAASPFNVAAVVAKIKAMAAGEESTVEYYIKGKVLEVKTDAATISQYGNHTFTMVDEGDNSTVFTAFQVYGPGKKKFTSVDDIKVGDEVVVCGKVVNYRGNTPETVGKGAAYVVSINATGGGGGTGEEGTPVTCAEAVQLTNNLTDGSTSTETYTITGYITEVIGSVSKNQQSFWMADTKDGGKVFQAYWANLPEGVTAFTVGMKVKITGKLMKYVKESTVTPEMKNATVVILADDGGGTDTSTSTKDKPFTVSQAKAASGNNYVKGYIVGYVDGQTLSTGAKFDVPTAAETEILLAETASETNPNNVLPVQLPAGDIRSALELFAHPEYLKKEVLLYGSLEKYFGTQGMKATSWASIDGKSFGQDPDGGSGGGSQGGDIKHITIAEFLQKADANTTYELTGIVKNIANTTYGNFDLVEGDASIYIYGLLDLEGKNKNFSSLGIEEGDEVTLTGKYKLFNNKPEIENAQFVRVKKGGDDGGGQGGDDQGGDQGGGDTVSDLVNGDFESWVSDSEPTGWVSACTASNATLSKSTESRNGNYACLVGAPGTQNKRLATQEITLEAGKYTFSFYAKSTTGDICQTRAGYVPIKEDGSVGTYTYKDAEGNDVYIDLNNTSWTLVTYDFELTSTTTICLLVMNPKETAGKTISQDILVDDAALVKK